jgi:hypothetical protein
MGPSNASKGSRSLFSPSSIFWSKDAYKHVADEFHPYHKHDLNVFLHLWTTGLGVWGALQLVLHFTAGINVHIDAGMDINIPSIDIDAGILSVYTYAALIALTTPFITAALHTLFVFACLQVPAAPLVPLLVSMTPGIINSNMDMHIATVHVCMAAIVLGYGLQDVAHYICQEKTYMGSYIGTKPWMVVIHSIWLMPLVVDAVLARYCFLPNLVSRNRNVVCQVASRQAVQDLREWINKEVPAVATTTHVWPHKHQGTAGPTLALEHDAAILAGFRKVFAAKHYDIEPVQSMNEIYVTAVGAKRSINSDAVFYTPHTDGPYWWLPGASLYRVLVGVTPNTMVRTRFNLQHASQDQVVDMYGVLGFDYNRELHWIDHVPGETNKERRSLVKLHFVVYPKGWKVYGKLCANLNANYNTWARGNFLRTLNVNGMYEYVMAWWIWITTISNATFEENVGWSNVVYVAACYALGPVAFLVLTSFRHYAVYMATFAFRENVAHGFMMRDVKLFKTIALMHLGRRLVPLVSLPDDTPGVLLAVTGFMVTILATAQLGMVRTYFGSELGFVKPSWIEGFPYNTIPHPMIVGQLFAYSSILVWWWNRLSFETVALIATHMSFYTAHMVQEMLTSSY